MSLGTLQRSRSRHISRACLEALEGRRLLSFAPAATYTALSPWSIESGDFNGDGDADLVVAKESGIGVRLNAGDGTFGGEATYPIGGHEGVDVVVGDVNADGKLDLVAVTRTERISGYYAYYGYPMPIYTSVGHVKVLLGHGDGTFTPSAETVELGDGWYSSVALGDLDEDGDLDAALAQEHNNSEFGNAVTILPGDGDGTFGAPRYKAAGRMPKTVSITDVDGDSDLDLITTSSRYDPNVVLGNGDGTFQPPQSVDPGGDYAVGQAVGDVNGDARLDLVFSTHAFTTPWGTLPQMTEDRVNVLLGNSNGTFGAARSYWVGGGEFVRFGESVKLGDFNADGEIDIAAANFSTSNVSILPGNGDGTFGLPEALSIAPMGAPVDMVAADFNGDGKPDIATVNDAVSVFLNTSVAPPRPLVSVSDATVTEGNTGSANATFTLTLSHPSDVDVTVHYATANLTATAGGDYTAASGTVTIPAGQTSRTFTVAVAGDRIVEPSETFAINLSAPTTGSIRDGQGIGTILDNEPRVTINNVTKSEGNGKTTAFSFTVSLSNAYDQAVTVNYATAGGTATAETDYQSKTGTLTFAPGETTRTITIAVIGDRQREVGETFFVDLSGPSSNALVDVARGIGTILNDDNR